MEKSDKPMLLSNAICSVLGEIPFDRPMYNGRHYIGIMRQSCNRRVIWRFIYRGDGRPLFNTYFDEVRHFSYGYATVRSGSKWYFINEDGKLACRHRFLEVGNVDCNGQASVLHPSYLDPNTKLPIWVIYTLPAFLLRGT